MYFSDVAVTCPLVSIDIHDSGEGGTGVVVGVEVGVGVLGTTETSVGTVLQGLDVAVSVGVSVGVSLITGDIISTDLNPNPNQNQNQNPIPTQTHQCQSRPLQG